MNFRTGTIVSLAMAYFILAVATAAIAQKEVLIAMRAPSWDSQAIIDQGEGEVSTFSTQAAYAATDACLRVAMSPEGLISPSVKRKSLARACLRVMAKIIGASPEHAYAWFAQAYFSQILGHLEGMNAALERSYFFGPNEQWIAEYRAMLAERAFPELSNAAMRGHSNDLALLVQSRRGIRAIAQRYINDLRFRTRITDIVEGLPRADQRRFISSLQQEVRGQ